MIDRREIYTIALLKHIIETLASPIFIKNKDHQWIMVNDAFCKLMNQSRENLIGKSDIDFFANNEARVFLEKDNVVFKSREININEEYFTDAANQTHYLQTTKTVFVDSKIGDVLCGVISDITDLKAVQDMLSVDLFSRTQQLETANKKLKELAYVDKITGLCNRTAFEEEIAIYTEEYRFKNKTFALLSLDMDGLKYINDCYGHPVGDDLISEFGKRVHSVVVTKGFIARIGGDEFQILFEYVHIDEVNHLAKCIIEVLKPPTILENQRLFTQASIGIACFPEHGSNHVDLIKHADNAMYHAKNTNKGGYAFYQEIYFSITKRKLELATRLREAFSRNEITVYFQPIVSTQGTIVGYEALTRWFSPELGTVSPAEFIPIAEETDLIIDIGINAIKAGTEFLNKLEHSEEYISINISTKQFSSDSFYTFLISHFKTQKVDTRRLVFEVTESLMMLNNGVFEELYGSLSKLDIRFFIDDFGTGFSNLAQLKRLKFHGLKVDREFVKDLPSSKADIALLKIMIMIAKEFGLKIVAEGVENIQQAECLTELGCDYMQGYYFGKPSPP